MDVWRIDLAAAIPPQWGDVLDQQEQQRASRFRFERDRQRFIRAHVALRWILAGYAQQAAADLVFDYGAYGKPMLANSACCTFNLSHSGELALCAVVARGDIGVDVEQCRDLDFGEMAQRFFSPSEFDGLKNLTPAQWPPAFFACWTRKEAYIKARGLGLSLPLDQFSVESLPGRPAALLSSEFAAEDVARYRLWDLPVAAGYRAALAYAGPAEGPPVLRDWRY